MPRPTPMGIRHEVFALVREGIKQGAIAARVGLTRATVNRILKRHAATGSLVPGKSSGAPRKTTPWQDRALLRMVRQNRFLSARALTARMRNLYGMRAGRTMVNNRLLSRGYRAYRPTMKPLLTANHHCLRLEWAQRWRNLTVAHWQHVIFGDESRFQLYPVDGRLRVRRLPGERFRPGCQAHRVQAGGGSVNVWGAFHNSAKSPLVLPDGYLTDVLYRGILQNTLVPFARHYFGDNYRYQDDNATPHRARVVLDFLQQGNVFYNTSPPRMFLSLDLLWEYWIQYDANGPLYVTSCYSTWIFCRGVSGFATDCPCDIWCRGLTTCLLHVGPPFGNRILNNSWAVGLT